MQARSRLAIVIPGHWSHVMGGAQYQVKLLMEALVREGGHDIFYLARNYDPEFKGRGYQLVDVTNGLSVKHGYKLLDMRSLIHALRRVQPQCIYQRVGCAYTGAAAYYAKRSGCRLVWHVAHDSDVDPRMGMGRRNVLDWIERRVLDYGIRNATMVVAQTKSQANRLKERFGRDADAVIANFHPLPVERIVKDTKLQVLWIGNLKPIKQPDVFIRLAQQLGEQCDAEFSMIGAFQGAGRWRERIEAEIAATPNVRYLGVQTQEAVNRMLSKGHLLVNTSLSEGFSNTFIQAWLRAVPVVSLAVDPDGVLSTDQVGLYSGNLEKLVANVKSLIADDDRRAAMGQRAAEYARAYHSAANVNALSELLAP